MQPLRQTAPLLLLLAALPTLCAAGPMRQYNSELGEAVRLVKSGALKDAVAQIEKNNAGADKDILYFFEKGELFSLGSNYTASRDTWLKGDEIIQAWENDIRNNSSRLSGDIGSYLISDKTRRYEGQDYEKVLLSTRLTLDHIMLGNFEHARIEMKKTYEREKLIEAFREKEYEALKAEAQKQETGQIARLDGYPMEEIDTTEVRELKNGFQNAFAHYLAGYFFEVTDEPSLAEPGYRNALQLAPGKAIIQSALEGVGKARPDPGEVDVLFVIETGFAPSIDSLNIPIPIPRKNGIVITPLSFPVIKSSSPVPVPASLTVAVRQLPVETLTNTDTMARRQLKDQMPSIILRSVIRSGFKSVVQDQANKAHWVAGLLANVVAVATEQADDRNWRTLPERISVARTSLPQGRHLIEFQTSAGSYRTEADVAGRFTIVPIRITGDAVYVGQPNLATGKAPDFVAEKAILQSGTSRPDPGPTPAAPVEAAPTSPAPMANAPPPASAQPGEPARAALATQPPAVSGKRVTAGDTTFIGDFSFAQAGGRASGQGVVEWRNGDRFEGRLENGLRQGKGRFTSQANGFRYEGEMKDDEFHGQGTYTSENGTRYEGNWKNGVKDGQGKLTFPDGDFWEGLFSNDERTDQGKMTFVDKPGAKPAPEAAPEGKP